MNKIEAYKLILKTIDDCNSQVTLDTDISRYNLPLLIKKSEIEEEFGIVIKNVKSKTWFDCGYYSTIGLYGSAHGRSISWSDDDSQPEDEWLYQISFPTGAYIFGKDYCTNTFELFFAELKSFSPKYSDANNHNLYFTSDTAAKVHNALTGLLKKYSDLVQNEINEKRIVELQKELQKLVVAK
jgi:hypothetical protein